jgi:hypothetical protein
MTAEHHIFKAQGAERIGDPADAFESERIEWLPLSDIPSLIAKGDISSGTTMVALLYLVAESGPDGQAPHHPEHGHQVLGQDRHLPG